MNTLNVFKKLSLIIIAVFTITSCSNDDDNPPAQEPLTIADLAIAAESLSSLEAALIRADLVTTLDGTEQFTVFAPTNDAFTAFLSENGFATLEDVPVPVLRQVLLNHVIPGALAASDLSTGYINSSAVFGTTDSNLSMYVEASADGVTLNGVSNVTAVNVLASNGIVHVVDAVIGLPTVVTFATADPNFQTLVTALTTLTPSTDFAGILSRNADGNADGLDAPFTVFAPTEAAFTALGTPPAEDALTQVLLHHVLGGANVRSGDLTPDGDTTATTLQGDDIIVTLPGTGGNIADVTDGAGNTDVGIVVVDVQASNGVIHALNKVMLPSPSMMTTP
ncbi:fasciclin domain-containing protein [uncultured Algibacter sp.]|uniref:fasciclin domain-containing protein n=1 Tax=uncultured Algibacter sp. TaxID=298659 RepID=UPI003216BE8E